MTVVVNHSTPADGTFSATGATAWNADHTISGVLPVANGGTDTTTSTGTGSVVLSDSPTFTTKITTPAVTASTTDLTLSAISTGAVKFSTLGGLQAQVSNIASAVNYHNFTGSATGKAITYSAASPSDSNISMAFQPKGTGAIDLAAGSSGVNISNGGTVTAITRTAGGTGYGTAPTVTISPPTTTGGVQATATCTVTAGVVDTVFTITNAGSGYIEQPTVTFSGGGGSGAAAYASVGGTSTIRALGTALNFNTSAGQGFGILDNGQSTVNFWGARGGATGNSPNLTAYSTTSIPCTIDNGQAQSINFRTNTNVTQAVVSHTASAVDYVQVTGGTTVTKTATISAQGSDTDVSLALTPKGAGAVVLNNAVTMSATTEALNLGNSQTTGAITIGGSTATGGITIGSSSGTQTVSIATSTTTHTLNLGTGGPSASSVKTINIGTGLNTNLGTKNINIGTSNGTGTYAVNISIGPTSSIALSTLTTCALIKQTTTTISFGLALITSPVVGMRAFVTDSVAGGVFGTPVVSGGSYGAPVYYDGFGWVYG